MDFIRSLIFLAYLKSYVFAGLWGESCPGESSDDQNEKNLRLRMGKKLFGQHIVLETIPKVVANHLSNRNPKKALVLSFHGTTGNGKTYVSEMIANHIYEKGPLSKYFHVKMGDQYRDLRKLHDYKKEFDELIKGKTKLCGRSLFVFSEIEEMPPSVLNILRPYMKYNDNIDGVNYRKNIFIFLSNIGGELIREVTLQHLSTGAKRETITSKQFENILSVNSLATGGFEKSHLILSGLVDFFLPFLPLEKFHVKQCVLEELSSRNNLKCGGKWLEITDKVADEIEYYPLGKDAFSLNGCKMIHKKSDKYL